MNHLSQTAIRNNPPVAQTGLEYEGTNETWQAQGGGLALRGRCRQHPVLSIPGRTEIISTGSPAVWLQSLSLFRRGVSRAKVPCRQSARNLVSQALVRPSTSVFAKRECDLRDSPAGALTYRFAASHCFCPSSLSSLPWGSSPSITSGSRFPRLLGYFR